MSEAELTLLVGELESVIYVGYMLFVYLLADYQVNISLGSFVVYMEAVGVSSSFLDEIRAINVENR